MRFNDYYPSINTYKSLCELVMVIWIKLTEVSSQISQDASRWPGIISRDTVGDGCSRD